MVKVGDVLDKTYRLTREIGAGGMGTVFEARRLSSDEAVAIKVLSPTYAESQTTIRRFQLEAEAVAEIGHAGIVKVWDVEVGQSGSPYFVMELLEGESLGALIKREGKQPPDFIREVAIQTLSALAAVHRQNIIHRDLKPDNIFLDRRSEEGNFQIKILDFGICKVLSDADLNLTSTGTVMGTPYYMSPEQARGRKDLDQRTDMWSLGVILYESLAGQKPYHGDTYNEVLAKILTEPFRAPQEVCPTLSRGWERVLLRALARDRAKRYQSADEFLADVEAIQLPDALAETATLSSPSSQASPEPEAPDDAPTEIDISPIAEAQAPAEASRPAANKPLLSRSLIALLIVCFVVAAGAVVGLGMLIGSSRPPQERAEELPSAHEGPDSDGASVAANEPSRAASLQPSEHPSPSDGGAGELHHSDGGLDAQPAPDASQAPDAAPAPDASQAPDAAQGEDAAHADHDRSEVRLAEVRLALRPLGSRVRRCVARRGGSLRAVRVQVRADGRGNVTYLGSAPHLPTWSETCLRQLINQVRIRASGGAPVVVTHTFRSSGLKASPFAR